MSCFEPICCLCFQRVTPVQGTDLLKSLSIDVYMVGLLALDKKDSQLGEYVACTTCIIITAVFQLGSIAALECELYTVFLQS